MPTRCSREDRPQEAAAQLEKDRAPVRSDIELAIGRAYEAAGDKQKAADAFRNVYFNLPASFESEAAGAELRKLGVSGSVGSGGPAPTCCSKASITARQRGVSRTAGRSLRAERTEIQLRLANRSKKRTEPRCAAVPQFAGDATATLKRAALSAERDRALHQRRERRA